MNIVVTGSSGRVGQAVAARLSRHHAIVGIDRSPSSTTSVVADITDQSALSAAFRNADAVVHAAALHAPHVPFHSERSFFDVNVEGTRAVAQACLDAGVGTLVFTSTTALYGAAATPADCAGWITEQTAPLPRTVYHRTKLFAESLLKDFSANSRLMVTVLRMSRCFPEPAPLMACYRLHRGIDVRDVASAHERALERGGAPFRVFNISGTTPFHEEDVAMLKFEPAKVFARRAPGLVAALAHRGWPLPGTVDRVYVSALAQRELGWYPRFGYEEVFKQYDQESPEVLPPSAVWV